jgi:Peptidase family M28
LGHRGSTTDGERRGADYLVAELRSLGLEPDLEPFAGSPFLGAGLLLHIGVAASGAGLFWTLPTLGAILGAVALASLIAETSTRWRVLGRLLARRPSANVVVRVPPPGGMPSLRLVVCGHYDTQRTGIISAAWLWDRLAPLQRHLPAAAQSPLLPVSLAMLIQTGLGLVGPGVIGPVVWTAAAAGILGVYAGYGALLAEWSLGAHVPGAADNASGAAAVVSLAEDWLHRPEVGVELVLLFTGCEETGALGAAAWADRHRGGITALPTVFLNLDGLGFGPPYLLGCGIPFAGLPVRYPPGLVAQCRKAAAEGGYELPEPLTVPGFTDGLALLARGLSGVTLVGCQPDGRLPHWHLPTDDAARMDFDAAWAGVESACLVMRRLAREMQGERPQLC